MAKLDLKDRKILYELDKNSRISFSSLSKKIGLKKETIRYRVNKLYEEGVIYKFITVINMSIIGLSFYKIFLRLENITFEEKNKMITDLASNKRVSWIGEVDGIYDLGMTVLVENHHILKNFLDELYEKYPNKIADKIISLNYRGVYHGRDYLIKDERDAPKNTYYESPHKNIELIDKTDFEILKILSQNSRLNSVEISRIINLSHDAIQKRIKKMEEKNIITGYTIILNNDYLSQLNYKVLLKLKNIQKEKLKKLHHYLTLIPNITYVVDSLLDWDMDFEIEVDDVTKFRKIMMSITNEFSDIIKEHIYLLIYNFRKYTYLSANYEYKDYTKNVFSI